jgi:putative NADPH-quinone reductase
MSKYDTVFIGFPIWWYREPSIIDTFIDSYDFTNKKVLLFCTSGGTGIESAVSNVKKMISEALSVEGKRLSNIKEAKQWINKER